MKQSIVLALLTLQTLIFGSILLPLMGGFLIAPSEVGWAALPILAAATIPLGGLYVLWFLFGGARWSLRPASVVLALGGLAAVAAGVSMTFFGGPGADGYLPLFGIGAMVLGAAFFAGAAMARGLYRPSLATPSNV